MRNSITLGVLLLAIVVPVFLAYGAPTIPSYKPVEDAAYLNKPEDAIQYAAQVVANIIGTIILAVAVIMVLFAAFNFLTAGGNEDKVAAGRSYLTWALVGVAVAIFAYVLPSLVQTLLQ